jgi:hypothetical protein
MKLHFIILPISLCGLLLFNSCDSEKTVKDDPENGVFVSNFENLYYWNESGSIQKGRGIDKSVCVKVDESFNFTPNFKVRISEVKIKKPHQIRVNGWFKSKDLNSSAKLIACLHYNGENLSWNGASTSELLRKAGVWTKIETVTALPDTFPPDAQVVVYGLRTGNGEILFDDLIIRVE